MPFYQDGTVLTQAQLDAAFATKEPNITAGTTAQYYRGDKTFQTLDKTAVGLANVDNTSDVNKPVSTAQAAADTATLNSAKAYADGLVVGLFDFRGNYDASVGTFPTTGGSGLSGAVLKGDVWRISVAGTLGSIALRVGDSIYAAVDTPAQVSSNWATIQLELGYNPEDVARKATDLSSNDNVHYPTTKAVNDALALLTTLKYWSEASQAVSSTVQRLIWQPKDPNGTFVRANTIQVLAIPNALTLRDPSESGGTFPTGFTGGLDLQMKGSTGTATTIPTAGSYAFGEGNTVSNNSAALGISNTVSAATGTVVYTGSSIVIGKSNNVAANASMISGITNTVYGSGHLIFGQSNSTLAGSSTAGLFGLGNNCSDPSNQYNFAFGRGNTVGTGGYAYGASNTATMSGAFAAGFNNSLTGGGSGSIAVGKSNTTTGFTNLLVGTSNSAADASSNSIGIGNSNININGTIVLGLNNNGYQYAGGMILGASNTCTSNGGLSTVIGFNNTVTSRTQNQSIVIGQSNSSGAAGVDNYNIGIGYAITQTSTGSLVVSGPAAGANDQGLSSFQAFGRKAGILAKRIQTGLEASFTDFTWYDVPNSTLQVLNNRSSTVTKFSCNAYVSWRDAGGTTALNQNRQAVLRVEAWINDLGSLIQSVHVVEGGDANFFTYFDLRLVLSGNGVKLQYQFVSDPTSGQTPYNSSTAPTGVQARLNINAILDQITQSQ